jgi:hypothetical protein
VSQLVVVLSFSGLLCLSQGRRTSKVVLGCTNCCSAFPLQLQQFRIKVEKGLDLPKDKSFHLLLCSGLLL